MYLPPLFPTLLRTTGAGFCYNIGRITAAFGTVFFGLFSDFGDHRIGPVLRRVPLPAGGVHFLLPAARCAISFRKGHPHQRMPLKLNQSPPELTCESGSIALGH